MKYSLSQLAEKFGKTVDAEQFAIACAILQRPKTIWSGMYLDPDGNIALERRMSSQEIDAFNKKHGCRLASEWDSLPIYPMTKAGKRAAEYAGTREPNHWW